jgi:hypothetical protein
MATRCGVGAQGLLEDFLGLQVAAVGQVHVGFGHRVHVASSIKLAGRVDHGRPGGPPFIGVNALATAGAEERIGLQPAFQEGAVDLDGRLALPHPVDAKAHQQRQQPGTRQPESAGFPAARRAKGSGLGLTVGAGLAGGGRWAGPGQRCGRRCGAGRWATMARQVLAAGTGVPGRLQLAGTAEWRPLSRRATGTAAGGSGCLLRAAGADWLQRVGIPPGLWFWLRVRWTCVRQAC